MLKFSKEPLEAKNRTSSMMWAGVSHENRYRAFMDGMCVWLLYREALEHVCTAGGSHIHPGNAPTRCLLDKCDEIADMV